jgi:NAD-dependent SIR2 family protein deacetylase
MGTIQSTQNHKCRRCHNEYELSHHKKNSIKNSVCNPCYKKIISKRQQRKEYEKEMREYRLAIEYEEAKKETRVKDMYKTINPMGLSPY